MSAGSDPGRSREGVSRRSFVIGAAGSAALVCLGAWGAARASGGEAVLRPPGAQDEERFASLCIRCEKCREVCPENVLRTLGVEKGPVAARTPTMDFHRGWCSFCKDANDGRPLCAEVCPTHAIQVPETARAQDVVIGVAEINRDWCLAWQHKKCKVCVEECPYEAVVFDDSMRPVMRAENCNGCGLCEHVCISLSSSSVAPDATSRAIVVRPQAQAQTQAQTKAR